MAEGVVAQDVPSARPVAENLSALFVVDEHSNWKEGGGFCLQGIENPASGSCCVRGGNRFPVHVIHRDCQHRPPFRKHGCGQQCECLAPVHETALAIRNAAAAARLPITEVRMALSKGGAPVKLPLT